MPIGRPNCSRVLAYSDGQRQRALEHAELFGADRDGEPLGQPLDDPGALADGAEHPVEGYGGPVELEPRGDLLAAELLRDDRDARVVAVHQEHGQARTPSRPAR